MLAIVLSSMMVFRYSLPLFIEWPTLMELTGDILIVLGARERILVYLLLSMVAFNIHLGRLIYFFGKSMCVKLSIYNLHFYEVKEATTSSSLKSCTN